ncbi:MAG: hypothetical protein QOG87_3075 [Actinomycetota bacterium]
MTALPTIEGDFDLSASPQLRDALPGLAPALDATEAATVLQQTIVSAGAIIERCRPGKALYLGADGCGLRYDVEIRDESGHRRSVLLLGRVLPDDDATADYQQSVAVLADRVAGRLDAAGMRPWAALPGNLVVHRFPIDPELPTLADAADPAVVSHVLGSTLEGLQGADVVLGHYGRRERCVLRYDQNPGNAAMYGKVWTDDRGALVSDTIDALAGRLGPAAVPRLLAYVPGLRLALLEALAGVPALAAGLSGTGPDPRRLVGDAAAVAAALHGGDLRLPTSRAIDVELDELRGLVDMMATVAPELAAGFDGLLRDIVTAAAITDPLPSGPTHGDFTPSQLLSDGDECGLVDFDSMAMAEPALDLGQYLAYLRLAGAKAGVPAEALGRLFLAEYAATAGMSADGLAARTRVYGCISLFRTTVHAWQKLKPKRAVMVFRPLAEEVACLSSPG